MEAETPTLYFQGGTLVLDHIPEAAAVPPQFKWIKSKWRCEAYHYPALLPWLATQTIRDQIPRWQTLNLALHDLREPHAYQTDALKAWTEAEYRGSIVLPTGAGKTFVAIQAIQQVARSAIVVAPTIDLLHQWYARLSNAFNIPVGVYYGGEKQVEALTVTTYHSAGDFIANYGNQFKLIIYDEVHHLPAPAWGETALMTPAPFRLGLTATYPEEDEQMQGRWRVDELIGKIVYEKRIDDLAGKQLAEYRTERIKVNLNPDERQAYDHDFGIYSGYFQAQNLRGVYGGNWLREMMRRSAFDLGARRALLARQRLIKLLAGCEAKFTLLEHLLREHLHESVLIFTENNDVVYTIARRHLIPALTHETKAAERKHILEGFQAGVYRAIVTSRVLNEGVDVPEAKVAIVLGGTSSAREYIQRLGRVLRKTGNRQALLFELVVRNSIEEGKSQRRKPKQADVNH